MLAQIFATGGLSPVLAGKGFALPRLLTRFNSLTASLTLGILWSLFHLLPVPVRVGSALHSHDVGLQPHGKCISHGGDACKP